MGDRIQSIAEALTRRPVFWVALVVVAFALPLSRSMSRDLPPPPPVLGTLDDFTLVDQDGRDFSLADMRGRVHIVNFIFTSCGEVCPRLSTRMRELQERLDNMGDTVHLVSISVDPTRDTPEVLKDYAQRYTARPGFWTFLTGPLDSIEETVVGSFKMAMQRTEVEDTGFFDIVHGERFVLVDQLGNIRGYYESSDEGLQELLNEAGRLANLGPRVSTPDGSVVSLR